MEILGIVGIAILTVVLSFIFKELKQEYSVFIMIIGGTIITLWGLIKIYPVINYVQELTNIGSLSEYFTVILKALGISFIVQIAADICKDFGQNSLAGKVEFAGKAAILIIVMPVLQSVINMGMDLVRN
jgi:stage III sporulation protein AD